MNKRHAFTAQVILAVLTGAQSQADVCREHGLKPDRVARGRANALTRLPDLFRRDDGRPKDNARIAALERAVGRLTLQLGAAKSCRTW
jgi:hypothetical protein